MHCFSVRHDTGPWFLLCWAPTTEKRIIDDLFMDGDLRSGLIPGVLVVVRL